MSEKQFNDLDSYIDEMMSLGIKKIAFAETNERRAEQVDQSVLEIVHVKRLELLSYQKGTIYKMTISDADLNGVYQQLTEKGFEVERIDRNIT